MNQVTEEKKEALTKSLAIAGFIAVVVFIVWLAVQIVSVLPSAFSSLASIADVVYNYNNKQELEVTTPNSVINAGESFTISWTDMRKNGSYAFTYKCADGVALEIRKDGAITTAACDTSIELGDVNSLEMRITSEKARFADVSYTITFTEEGKADDAIAKDGVVTIVNASIPTTGIAEEEPKEEASAANTATSPKPATTPAYTAGKPVTVTKYVYVTPVSDPKGKIDLQVTFLGFGTLESGVFKAKSSIDIDDQGALQFEVKNIGTKTAEDWEYEAHLPSDITYKSPDQKALKPNERSVITLGFSGINNTGTEKVSVEVTAKNDIKNSNNEFTKSVKIVD